MHKKILFSASVILLCISANAQVNSSWKEHKLDSIGFTVRYPPTWTLNNTRPGAVFFIMSPKESDNDKFDENFNLQFQTFTGSLTLKEFVKQNMEELKTFENFKKESERYFYTFGKEAYEVVFTGNVSGIDFPLRWKQWYVVDKQRSYVITYCTAGDKKDKYESIANGVFRTIRIR